MVGAAKGVIRSMLCDGSLKSEIIPVDVAINCLLVLPFHFKQLNEKPEQIPVFNITVPESQKRPWKWIMEMGREYGLKYPFEVGLWYPDGNLTMNKYYHWFCVICFMWLPALLIDGLFAIFGQRRFMIRVQKRIAIGLEVLQFFTTRSWDFKSRNFYDLNNILTPAERKLFRVNTEDVNDYDYIRICILGSRQYVMKEPLESIPRARLHLNILFVLDRFCKTLIIFAFFYWMLMKSFIADFIKALIAD